MVPLQRLDVSKMLFAMRTAADSLLGDCAAQLDGVQQEKDALALAVKKLRVKVKALDKSNTELQQAGDRSRQLQVPSCVLCITCSHLYGSRRRNGTRLVTLTILLQKH